MATSEWRPHRVTSGPYVVCEDLIKIYKEADLEVVALRGLDLQVGAGEFVAIVGTSGSGKTTLLNILAGLDSPSAGHAYVGERDLLKMGPRDLEIYRQREVGLVWQQTDRNLAPYATAYQNVETPLIVGGWGKRARQERVEELLETVGLADRMHYIPRQLSGGEQQRVAIAVALAQNPPLVLADEPTGELDTLSAQSIFDLFRTLGDRYGTTIVVVTHDMNIAAKVDRVVAIRDGRTSTETVRRERSGQEPQHEEYVVVDGAGRLQLPREYREQLQISQRARVSLEEDHIAIRPASDGSQQRGRR